MELKRLLHIARYCTLLSSAKRSAYLRRKKIFGHVGENVFLPFMVLPLRCENIYIHSNVEIASGARLVPHDAIHGVFNRMNDGHHYAEHIGRIEILDNVFIGADAIILGPCKIGPNAVIAAGAVVTGDIPAGSVAGGVPARVIGDFDSLREKRRGQRPEEDAHR